MFPAVGKASKWFFYSSQKKEVENQSRIILNKFGLMKFLSYKILLLAGLLQ